MIAGCMATKLKVHQWEGVRFLWKNVVLEFEVNSTGRQRRILHDNTDCRLSAIVAHSNSGLQDRMQCLASFPVDCSCISEVCVVVYFVLQVAMLAHVLQ